MYRVFALVLLTLAYVFGPTVQFSTSADIHNGASIEVNTFPQQSTPDPVLTAATPDTADTFSCWVESDGERIGGDIAHMPIGSRLIDCTAFATPDPADNIEIVRSTDDTVTIGLNDADNPGEVWDALIDLGFRGTGDEHCECLTIPNRFVVDAPVNSYLITANRVITL